MKFILIVVMATSSGGGQIGMPGSRAGGPIMSVTQPVVSMASFGTWDSCKAAASNIVAMAHQIGLPDLKIETMCVTSE